MKANNIKDLTTVPICVSKLNGSRAICKRRIGTIPSILYNFVCYNHKRLGYFIRT